MAGLAGRRWIVNLLAGSGSATLLDRLAEALRARSRPLHGEERPAAVLWSDPGREWGSVVGRLRERLPELLALGDFDPDSRSGPAIWLRWEVDAEPAGEGDRGAVPILYLPGVRRQELRAGEDCPERLKPLVELLHRGAAFHHPNGKDWTAAGFLTSPKGIGLDLAEDGSTLAALRSALAEVAESPLSRLRGRRLEADDFDRLLVGDLPRNLLLWLCDPVGTRRRLGGHWGAFRSRSRKELDFDPENGAEAEAARRLVSGSGGWDEVWERFAEAPEAFSGVEDLLRRNEPGGGPLFRGNPARRPQENDRREGALREALAGLPQMPHTEACDRVAALETGHGVRREWVWARLGRAPLARALEPLARLARAARSPLGGADPDEIAAAHLERGWAADAAGWEAFSGVGVSDEPIVAGAVRCLLEPWLEASARAFQAAARRTPLPGPGGQPVVEAEEDGCLFFVDGLRYDLGRRLAERLEGRGLRCEVRTRWAALPTVTATAKPAVTPLAPEIEGDALGEDFAPRFPANRRPVQAKGLRNALEGRGYQLLAGEDPAVPRSAAPRGWLETGAIDKTGHQEQEGLARRLPEELDRLAERIAGLLEGGWRSVRVVTDHGWLLLPGGLPRVSLPKHLTESRWARCAVLAGSAASGADRWPWHWNAAEWFAAAPGIACFDKSDAFAHGGLSIQECLTPDLLVERSAESERAPSIESVTWRRWRCFVTVAGGAGLKADLRLRGAAGASVANAPKPVDADGAANLVLAGDEHEAADLRVVLLDAGGTVVAARDTRVGSDS